VNPPPPPFTKEEETLLRQARDLSPGLIQRLWVTLDVSRAETRHWKSNHDGAVAKKRVGQETTSGIIADLRDEVAELRAEMAKLKGTGT